MPISIFVTRNAIRQMRIEITRWPKWLHDNVMQHPNMHKFGIESVLNSRPFAERKVVCMREDDECDPEERMNACLNEVPNECTSVLLTESVNKDGSINNEYILV